MKRIRFRKAIINEIDPKYNRYNKRALLKSDRDHIKYLFYGNNKKLSKLLIGKCCIFEGVEPFGWYPNPNDLIIYVEGDITRKEIKYFNNLANRVSKESFYIIDWLPRGIPELLIAAIKFTVEEAASYIFQKILDEIFNKSSSINVKKIDITPYDKGSFNLILYDQHNRPYRFIINIDDTGKSKSIFQV